MASLMPTPAHREFLPEPARAPRGKCRFCPGGPAIVQRCGGTRGGVSWRRACSIVLVAVAFVCLVTFQLLGYAFFEGAANHFALRLQDRRWSAPLPTGDGWRAYADHVCDEIGCPLDTAPWLVRPGDVVFLKVDAATWYLTTVAPRVQARHILVMHNGDLAFTAAHARLVSALPPVRSSVSPAAALPGVLPSWMDEQQRRELDGALPPPPPPPDGQPAPASGPGTAHGLAHVYDDMPGSVAAVFAQNIDPLASLSRLYALPIGLENRPFTIGSHPAIYAHQQPQRVFAAHMKRVGPLVEAVAGACDGVRAVVARRTAAGISGFCTSVASCVFDPVIDVHTTDVAAALLDVLVRPGYNWRRRRGSRSGSDGGSGGDTSSTSSETAAAGTGSNVAPGAGSTSSAARASPASVWSDPLHTACDALLYKSTAASGAADSDGHTSAGIPPPRALVYAAFGTGSNPRERTHAASVLASAFPWTLNAVGGMGGTAPSHDAIAGWVTVFRGLRAIATAPSEGVPLQDLATEEELAAARELVGQVISALDCRVVAPPQPPLQPPQGRRLSAAGPVGVAMDGDGEEDEAAAADDSDGSIANFFEAVHSAAKRPAARVLFAGDGTTSTGTGMPVFEVPNTEEPATPAAAEASVPAPAAPEASAPPSAPAPAAPPPEPAQEQPELTLSSSSGDAASIAAAVAVEEQHVAPAAAPPLPPVQEQQNAPEPAAGLPAPVEAPAPAAPLFDQQLRRSSSDAPARTQARNARQQQPRSPPRRLPSALDERIWSRAKAGADTHGDYGGSGMTSPSGAAVRARAGDSNRPFTSWWAAVANSFTGNRALPSQWEGTLKANIALTTCVPFIPSPAGNGWQSHRTWEALHIGSIPLAMGTGNVAMDDVHAGLPVVVVRSWEQAGSLGTLLGAWVRLHWVWRNTLASDGVSAMVQQGRAGRRYPPTRLTNGGAHEAATSAASSASSTLRTSASGGTQLLRRRTPPNRAYQLDTETGAWHWYAPGPPVFDPRVVGDYPWNDPAQDANSNADASANAAAQPQPEQLAAPEPQPPQQPADAGEPQRRRKRASKAGDGGGGDDDDDLFSLVAEPVVEHAPQAASAGAARASAGGGGAPAPPLPRLSPEQQRFRGDVWLAHQHRSVFAPERLFLGHWLTIVDKLRYHLQADDGIAAA